MYGRRSQRDSSSAAPACHHHHQPAALLGESVTQAQVTMETLLSTSHGVHSHSQKLTLPSLYYNYILCVCACLCVCVCDAWCVSDCRGPLTVKRLDETICISFSCHLNQITSGVCVCVCVCGVCVCVCVCVCVWWCVLRM